MAKFLIRESFYPNGWTMEPKESIMKAVETEQKPKKYRNMRLPNIVTIFSKSEEKFNVFMINESRLYIRINK